MLSIFIDFTSMTVAFYNGLMKGSFLGNY